MISQKIVQGDIRNKGFYIRLSLKIVYANKYVTDNSTYQLHDEDQDYALQTIFPKNVHITIFHRILQIRNLQTITDTGITGYILKFSSRYSKQI